MCDAYTHHACCRTPNGTEVRSPVVGIPGIEPGNSCSQSKRPTTRLHSVAGMLFSSGTKGAPHSYLSRQPRQPPSSGTPELNWVSLASRASRLPSSSYLISVVCKVLRPTLSGTWESNPVSLRSERSRLPPSSHPISDAPVPVCLKALHHQVYTRPGRLIQDFGDSEHSKQACRRHTLARTFT